MGATKNTFLELKEQEIATLYDATFTKKEAQKTGVNLAKQIIDGGNFGKHECLANLVRLNEVINNAITELKQSVSDEKITVMGVEFTPMNGRTMYSFSEDELHTQLTTKLKQREELLKLATKSDESIYDSDGVEVPKVSINYSKSSLTIKF
jgi:hypothetical protein